MYEVLYESSDLRCAVAERCFINIFASAPTVPSLRGMAEAHRRFLDEHPGTVITLNVVSLRGAKLDRQAQSEALAISQEFAPHTRALAYLVEAKGVIGSLQRGVVGAVGKLSRSPYPQRTFAKLEEACRWLARHNDETGSQSISQAVSELQTASA